MSLASTKTFVSIKHSLRVVNDIAICIVTTT